MQTVILSEFCRIVKKVLKKNKGKLALGKWAKTMERVKILEISMEESLGIEVNYSQVSGHDYSKNLSGSSCRNANAVYWLPRSE